MGGQQTEKFMLLDQITAIALGFSAAVAIGVIALGIGSTPASRLRIGALLTAWLAVIVALGASGALHAAADAASEIRGAALARFGMAAGLPLTALVIAVLSSRTLRERVTNMPTAALIGVNALRLLGILFILTYWVGRLPAPFAPIAGWGDILVGALAIPVAFAASRGTSRGAILAWNTLGLADLITAVGLGVTTQAGGFPGAVGTDSMTLLPLLLIPGFLVPLFAATHLTIFYKMLRQRSASGPMTAFA
jgi:hypothetical protein